MKAALSALAVMVTGVLIGLLGLLVLRGASGLTWEFIFGLPARAGREGGIVTVLLATGILVAGALVLALPVGVGAALYLQEYAVEGVLVGAIRWLVEALAGVPSIIFGLFGFSLFVTRFGWGWSLAAGSATLALMVLPTVIRTAEEAVAAVPRDLKEGAVALGASRWQMVRRVVMPAAGPGIATGAILALGRSLGETAAVLLTAGSDLGMPGSPLDPGRSMAVHLYILATEGLSDQRAYATALLLVIGVLLVNLMANILMERWQP